MMIIIISVMIEECANHICTISQNDQSLLRLLAIVYITQIDLIHTCSRSHIHPRSLMPYIPNPWHGLPQILLIIIIIITINNYQCHHHQRDCEGVKSCNELVDHKGVEWTCAKSQIRCF